MKTRDKELELADEQTAQRLYSRELQKKSRQPVPYQTIRSRMWVDGLPAPKVMSEAHLIGRVALTHSDPDLDGSDFYIGETRATLDGVRVFSWAAPVACTFFRGTRHHEWCDDVAVIRAFSRRGDLITDFHDEVIRDDVPVPGFRKRGLSIPVAPARSLPRPKLTNGTTQDRKTQSVVRPAAPATRHRAEEIPVRAEALLRAQLQAPRTKSLASVLATLQPDQYDLVTEPAMTCMIVEGQPGTGKTIVASHRVAYLINEETLPEKTLDGDILLVGPTDGYSRHVRSVVARLTDGSSRVKVRALPTLMNGILGLKNNPGGPDARGWRDVDAFLGELATKAVYQFRSIIGHTMSVEKAYEYLRANGETRHPVTTDPEWIVYLRSLPPYRKALTLRVHTPLLALLQVLWEGTTALSLGNVEHIVVDEAQDVTALEWYLLAEINQTIGWTLLGDLNQRRSDHTLATWSQVLDVLGVEPGEAAVRTLQRGYRSTRPILQYASRLLPARERNLLAFQSSGPEPRMTKTSPATLNRAIADEINRLLILYPKGTVAVIAVKPETVWTNLRVTGWSAEPGEGSRQWERDGRTVAVLAPDDARGLEYDAVIVVEPDAFPRNFGRQGPLYTALTRPNRELVILHTRPLPQALRRR